MAGAAPVICDNGTGVRAEGVCACVCCAWAAGGCLWAVCQVLTRAGALQFVKCGFAGNNLPDHLFPSCVGRPTLRAEEDIIGDIALKVRMARVVAMAPATCPLRRPPHLLLLRLRNFTPRPRCVRWQSVMCGDEADAARRGLRISYPIDNGKVLNWEDMEHLWDYIFFEKLKVCVVGWPSIAVWAVRLCADAGADVADVYTTLAMSAGGPLRAANHADGGPDEPCEEPSEDDGDDVREVRL